MQVPTGQPRWEFFMADIPSPLGTTTHNPMDQLRCCEELAKSGKENKPYELNFVLDNYFTKKVSVCLPLDIVHFLVRSY